MKDRPILMCGEMVRATLDGSKTQTRRVVKPQPFSEHVVKFGEEMQSPYGWKGDRLWVRETWRVFGGREYEYQKHKPSVRYRADDICGEDFQAEWRPSIHMPRWASRLTLEITEVRVERVQDITESDAKAEGVPASKNVEMKDGSPCYRIPYQILWNQINGCDAWDKNPWCWCITFRRL
jgi:hypothetical protein